MSPLHTTIYDYKISKILARKGIHKDNLTENLNRINVVVIGQKVDVNLDNIIIGSFTI